MLNRIEWSIPKIQPDVFSIESLIAWLEKQPADGGYRYLCNGHCLLAQYFTAAGFDNVRMWTEGFWHGPTQCPKSVGQEEAIKIGCITRLPPAFNRIADTHSYTFGAAAARARSASHEL